MDISLSLYKISDALGIPLHYDNGTISGSAPGKFKVMDGLELPITIEAQKLFFNETCGVLASVMGDLCILVTHYRRTSTVSAFLIDSTKTNMPPKDMFSKQDTMKRVVSLLRPGIVASFIFKDHKWSPLKLPA